MNNNNNNVELILTDEICLSDGKKGQLEKKYIGGILVERKTFYGEVLLKYENFRKDKTLMGEENYYENGELRNSKTFYKDGQTIYIEENFDEKGRVISKKRFYKNGILEDVEEFDADGNSTNHERFDENGNPLDNGLDEIKIPVDFTDYSQEYEPFTVIIGGMEGPETIICRMSTEVGYKIAPLTLITCGKEQKKVYEEPHIPASGDEMQ